MASENDADFLSIFLGDKQLFPISSGKQTTKQKPQ